MLFGESLLGFGVGRQCLRPGVQPDSLHSGIPAEDGWRHLRPAVRRVLRRFHVLNGYRKDADTTARGVYNFIFAVIGAGVIAILMNVVGMATGQTNWITEVHFTGFNWLGAVLLWIVCGPIALGCLLVAGRNLPAMDYSTIAYWEVPVALFIGLVVFGEPVTA